MIIVGLILPSLACIVGGQGTAIPPGRPASFDLQTASPTVDPKRMTIEPEVEAEQVVILPLSDVPTYTPNPNAPPTLLLLPTATSTPEPTEEPEIEPTATREVIIATPTVPEVELSEGLAMASRHYAALADSGSADAAARLVTGQKGTHGDERGA